MRMFAHMLYSLVNQTVFGERSYASETFYKVNKYTNTSTGQGITKYTMHKIKGQRNYKQKAQMQGCHDNGSK